MLVFLAFVAFKYDEKTVVAMSLLIILGQRTYPQQPYGGGYATGWDHVSRNRVEVAVVTINMVYGQQQNKQTQVPNTQQPDKPGFTYASTYGYGQQGKGYDKVGLEELFQIFLIKRLCSLILYACMHFS
ncbi:hypothetical protein R6Q59_025181 [Mikania micrantha]